MLNMKSRIYITEENFGALFIFLRLQYFHAFFCTAIDTKTVSNFLFCKTEKILHKDCVCVCLCVYAGLLPC